MQVQCSFSQPTKSLTVRTTDDRRDLLRVVAARRRVSVNKLINNLIDEVIQREKAAPHSHLAI